MSWQSPEIYNLVLQYHTQPLLDVFKAFLLVHSHGAEPVRPVRITPTHLTQLKPCRHATYANSHLSPTGGNKGIKQTLHWLTAFGSQGTGRKLCEMFLFYFIFFFIWLSPFFALKGLLSLSKVEYARSLRGSARVWALGALWGYKCLIAQRPPVIAALSDFNGRMRGWIIWTIRDYGNKGQRKKKNKEKWKKTRKYVDTCNWLTAQHEIYKQKQKKNLT